MSRFTAPVEIRQLVYRSGRPVTRGDRSQWVPIHPIPYEVGDEGSGVFITCPAWDFTPYADQDRLHWDKIEGAFASDFGSIPPVVRGVPGLAPDGEGVAAFFIHDLLYSTKGLGGVYTRKQADQVLKEALEVLGVGPMRRQIIYTGVRLGGGNGWGH